MDKMDEVCHCGFPVLCGNYKMSACLFDCKLLVQLLTTDVIINYTVLLLSESDFISPVDSFS